MALPFRKAIYREWQSFIAGVRSLDLQTVTVLTTAVVLVIIQVSVGSRRLFHREFAEFFIEEWRGILAWGWWFFIQGLTGFVVPVLILIFAFGRAPKAIGLGTGDWKLAIMLGALYMPLVLVGTWILSNGSAFQDGYPHYQPAAFDWRFFVIYELLFLFYWIGWEYLWRGFILFGTAHTFGIYAIFVQMVPFALLHLDKPVSEAVLSIAGGLALGALVWRCRSFWIAVPIHALQMLFIDLWCTLRLRTGVSGIGFDALVSIFRQL